MIFCQILRLSGECLDFVDCLQDYRVVEAFGVQRRDLGGERQQLRAIVQISPELERRKRPIGR